MPARISRISGLSGADLQAEGLIAWKTFESLSKEISGFEEICRSRYWYALDGAQLGNNLYTYFPFLFADAFPELSRAELRQVSVMTLLYLYHILLDDALIDDDHARTRPVVLASRAYLIKALHIAEQLFGGRPFPWDLIHNLHREYSMAVLREWHHIKAIEEYQPEDIFQILAAKSAMAKLIPVVLCGLTDRQGYLAPLCRSFELYYAADQLFDDYRDWKKDLRDGQYTYLLTQVIASCGLEQKISSIGIEQRIELVGKYFYLSGIADTYFDDIVGYWDQAKDSLGAIRCPLWTGFINGCQVQASAVRSTIVGRARTVLLQESKYAYHLIDSAGSEDRTPHPVPAVCGTVSEAGQRAADFLLHRYKGAIGFEDFVVFGETLPVWVGAYVGNTLNKWLLASGVETGEASHSLLRQLAGHLIGLHSETGWATREARSPDADTTAWVTSFASDLLGNSQPGSSDLLAFHRSDGGFATYLPSGLGEGFESYSESHVEVTAVVLETLLTTGFDRESEMVANAVQFIEQRQTEDGYWEAYWWDGRMYATYHCIRALVAAGKTLESAVGSRLIERMIADQAPDGSWGRETVGKNLAFETALAMRILLLMKDDPLASAAVDRALERAIVWLLNNQSADGSWVPAPMMRVPHGRDRTPWETKMWTLDSSNGVGVLVRDQNRFFTTAAALSAITDLLTRAGDRRLVVRCQSDLQAEQTTPSAA